MRLRPAYSGPGNKLYRFVPQGSGDKSDNLGLFVDSSFVVVQVELRVGSRNHNSLYSLGVLYHKS